MRSQVNLDTASHNFYHLCNLSSVAELFVFFCCIQFLLDPRILVPADHCFITNALTGHLEVIVLEDKADVLKTIQKLKTVKMSLLAMSVSIVRLSLSKFHENALPEQYRISKKIQHILFVLNLEMMRNINFCPQGLDFCRTLQM